MPPPTNSPAYRSRRIDDRLLAVVDVALAARQVRLAVEGVCRVSPRAGLAADRASRICFALSDLQSQDRDRGELLACGTASLDLVNASADAVVMVDVRLDQLCS